MCTRPVQVVTLPISPICDIFKIIVELPVLQVLGTENTMSPTSIYKILE